MKAQNFPSKGWVLYDGECAFCVNLSRRWKRVLNRQGFAVDSLQTAWVARCLKLSPAELLADLRFLTSNGDLYSGAEAYLQVMRQIWWAWPLYIVFRLPGLKQIFGAGYRHIAKHRYCISGACKVPQQPQTSDSALGHAK